MITGGAGFIGNHLARELIKRGKYVSVIDDLSTGLYENIADLEDHDNFSLYIDTVNNEALMEKLVEQSGVIYHLASAVGVKLIIEKPVYTIDNIYRTTETVLRLARRYRSTVLITSTSEVYGKSDQIPFIEDGDRLEGPTTKHRWAYACAKALDEFLALAHYRETRLPVVIVRLFNTVGPRQQGQYGMVVPKFVQWAMSNEPIQVYGNGEQTRCFCHVLDVVGALIDLMESKRFYGQIFNIGSTEEVSIKWLAQYTIQVLGSSSPIHFVPYLEVYGDGFEDMLRRVPNIDRIHTAIGWKPQRNIERIILDVADAIRNR